MKTRYWIENQYNNFQIKANQNKYLPLKNPSSKDFAIRKFKMKMEATTKYKSVHCFG